jgi:hypothetical protein
MDGDRRLARSVSPVTEALTSRRRSSRSTPAGNPFPQAFSHLALINAVMHLIEADERLSAEAVPGHGR